jgi:hypothetical protein
MRQHMDPEDARIVNLALGRMFRMMSRPEQPNDAEEYRRCRTIILDFAGDDTPADYRPNYARERNSGAAGD